MSETPHPAPGTIIWTDLTVPDAARIRDFYRAVAGWEAQPVSQGAYDDYNMLPPGADAPAAGICHARGANADLPPVWMVYITVDDLDASMARCKEEGGEVLHVRREGDSGLCVIKDPAGAICALYRP